MYPVVDLRRAYAHQMPSRVREPWNPARLADLAQARAPGTLADVDALDILCRSLRDDARLTPLAARPIEQLIVSGLVARLRLDALTADDEAPKTPPIIVCGLPRSGTTFLHRLLALAPAARVVPFWELHSPVAGVGPDHRRTDARAALGWLARSDAAPGRPMRDDLPDECGLLLRLAAHSQLYWALAPVHGYLDWLLHADPAPAYAAYRRVLTHLERQQPGRLTLKYPAHALHLDVLTAALPGARLVVMHRDPDEVVPSSHRLVCQFHARLSPDADAQRSIQGNTRRLALQAERTATNAGSAAVHIGHRALMADPVAVVERVHARLGLEPPDRAKLTAFIAEHPRPPRTTQTRITPGFEAYRDRFAPLF